MKIVKYSNSEIIKGIRNNNHHVFLYIYRECFDIVREYIVSKGGTTEDASDIFQQSLLTIKRKMNREEPDIYVNFKFFLLGYAKKIWLRDLEKMTRMQQQEFEHDLEDDNHIIKKLTRNEKLCLMWEYIEKMSELCRKIIKAFILGKRHRDTATQLRLSENQVKKRKYICQQKLLNAIRKDSRYKELRDKS